MGYPIDQATYDAEVARINAEKDKKQIKTDQNERNYIQADKKVTVQTKEEQEALRTELKEVLDELTYTKLMVGDAESVEAVNNINKKIPLKIFVG